MKKGKAPKTAHTSNSKLGMGDYYGSGVRNPMGRVIEDNITLSKSKKIGKAPRSLA